MKILPCHNKILIELVDDTTSNILLPDDSTDPQAQYVVVTVGPRVDCCKPGDQLLLRPNTNMAIMGKHIAGDRKLSIIDDTTVFAVLENAIKL